MRETSGEKKTPWSLSWLSWVTSDLTTRRFGAKCPKGDVMSLEKVQVLFRP